MWWLLKFGENEAKGWLPSGEGEQMIAWKISTLFVLFCLFGNKAGLWLCCFVSFSKVGFRNFQSRGNESLKLRMEISAACQKVGSGPGCSRCQPGDWIQSGKWGGPWHTDEADQRQPPPDCRLQAPGPSGPKPPVANLVRSPGSQSLGFACQNLAQEGRGCNSFYCLLPETRHCRQREENRTDSERQFFRFP